MVMSESIAAKASAMSRSCTKFARTLEHSVEEIAAIAECSVPSAKSALQRGRRRLKELVADGMDSGCLPLLSDHERLQFAKLYCALQVRRFRFNTQDARGRCSPRPRQPS